MNEPCQHKKVLSLFLADTDDHVKLCLDCRIVVHWCNNTEDEWRDHEKSRTAENRLKSFGDVLDGE